ncbi:TniQ family protein [Sulfurirhabdus autotrophica]|nr:TniQ family protein [Sulfurirhabdus autotrophica]
MKAPILPVRCPPLPDELLSSWLIRLAWLNAEKLYTFRRRFWMHPGSPWSRNIDLILPDDALAYISKMTLITPESLVNHMLKGYLGTLFEDIDPHGNAQGILTSRRRGQKVFGFGLQLCPDCLRSDTVPYFRRWWKVAYLVTCPIHRRLLIDACPGCQQPLAYHLSDFGKSLLPERIPTSFCATCEYNWSKKALQRDELIPDAFMGWQKQILTALETGWFEDNQIGSLYALSFFKGLHTLIRLVASKGHSSKLRQVIAGELGELPLGVTYSGSQNPFGGLRLGDRLNLLRHAYWLLQEWPERFIWATKKAKLAFSYIDSYKKQTPLPYWVASAAALAHDPRHTRISAEEKESVKRFLEKNGLPASRNQVNRWLGRWYVSRHKEGNWLFNPETHSTN